jgi:hypothetical protein
MKNSKPRRMTLPERRRAAAVAAMPEVRKLVKRYGRTAIGNCLAKIHAWEREAKRLNALRNEVKSLERRLHG